MAARHPPSLPLILWFFATLLALAGGGCRRQADSSIKGGNLQPAAARPALARPARRIVSLTPSLTEIVFSLGAGERVVGVSDYCDYPPEARTRPRVGTFLQPSVEKILALRPDLVLVDGVQKDVAAALQAAGDGATVLAIAMNDLAQVREAITQVGAALAADPAAAALLGQLDGELAQVRQQVAARGARPPRKVLFVVDRQLGGLRGLVVAGPGTYLDELVRLAGGVNIYADLKLRYAKVAVESIEERQPEVILDVGHIEAGGEQSGRADWLSLPGVPAVRDGRVYILADREFVTPGPRLGKALQKLASLIGSEAASQAASQAGKDAGAATAPSPR
jgi:iron complex transport system substrate-binding protein